MLDNWAKRWGIPKEALIDLRFQMTDVGHLSIPEGVKSEAVVSSRVRYEAANKGIKLYRNNVGAYMDTRKVPVRYGLANDSKALNKHIKSADLIGINPIFITPEHVGHTIGQFVSREVKRPSWVFKGTSREIAQLKWAELITSLGGDAKFTTGEGSF